ncbi:MAG: hypothetical protein D6737_13440 [Chloroflexi bacterium]|nr:MAG: hypothetical protein CUN54_04065 [Phototrophicales bacterium]RMF78855.1 MAG: hypothetical protein D6737_13440 [Chloroflexota bacterium]
MELLLVIRVLLRRWHIILIPVIITAAVSLPDVLQNGSAVSGGFTTQMRYSAGQVLASLPDREGDLQDVWNASAFTIDALTAWVHTDSFKREIAAVVREQNGVEINTAALGVAADNDRSIGQLFLSYPDGPQLEMIAAAAVEVLQTRSNDYLPPLGDEPALVAILDEPQIVAAPPPLPDRFAPLVKVGLGLLAGLGLALLAEYFDNTLRYREEVESLGLPVIGAIPRHK